MRIPKTWHWLGFASLFAVPAAAEAQPTIAFDSPTTIDEGEPIPIEVTVTGTTGITWSWDTDFDMTFDEHVDTTMYTVPATDTDGTVTLRIGVRAYDDSSATPAQTYRNIVVNNVAPEITSSPPLMGQVRQEYRYEVVVDDPAGANDPIEYVLTSSPEGMEITDNVISWVPTPAQRGRDFSVILRVSDGDGGGDDQTWDVRVANNTAPTTPTPVSPIMRAQVDAQEPVTLTVENATDSDGDPLLYFFRLSRTATFDGSDVIGSGEVVEGADGMTSWSTAAPIEPGHWYWQVWVSDDIEETEPVYASLVVGDSAALPDAGGPLPDLDGGLIGGLDGGGTGGGGGGCSVTHPGGAPASLAWLLGLGLGAILLSRRRR